MYAKRKQAQNEPVLKDRLAAETIAAEYRYQKNPDNPFTTVVAIAKQIHTTSWSTSAIVITSTPTSGMVVTVAKEQQKNNPDKTSIRTAVISWCTSTRIVATAISSS